MRLRFTQNALADLDEVLAYIETRSQKGAANVKRRVLEVVAHLRRFPRIGTPTNDADIRMLVATPCPYLIFYECDCILKEVVIHHIRHSKRERE